MIPSSSSIRNLSRGASRRSDSVYDAIRAALASGEIAPGERLRQEALAQELGVSQSTVREAFNRLITEGLAEEEPYKGVRAVILPSEEELDLIEMRIALECLAMQAAAGRISENDLVRMRELLPATVLREHDESPARAWEANREFHWLAIEASGRRHLVRTLKSIWNLTNHYLLYARSNEMRRRSAEQILEEHHDLLESLEARDGERACEVIQRSLMRDLRLVQEQLANSVESGNAEAVDR